MKALITIFLLLISVQLRAPVAKQLYILKSEGLKDQRLLNAIIQVESGGNPDVINWKENAIGLLQIREVMLKEVNRIVGYEKYSTKDCLDSLKSIEIYWTVQSFHNPRNELKRGALTWNGRGKTNKYWKKIQKELNK